MSWFRKEPSRPKPVTAARNDRGVVCFDLGLALLPERDFAGMLVSCGIEWHWTSIDNKQNQPANSPGTRPLTRLCDDSNQLFLDDLRDSNAEERDIAMVGIQPDSQELVQLEPGLTEALREFAAEGTGPVQAIYYREDDGDEVFYANWPLSEPVRSLIASWLIRPDDIRDFRWAGWQGWETKWLEGAIAQIIARAKA
jgi:hypothetical protein